MIHRTHLLHPGVALGLACLMACAAEAPQRDSSATLATSDGATSGVDSNEASSTADPSSTKGDDPGSESEAESSLTTGDDSSGDDTTADTDQTDAVHQLRVIMFGLDPVENGQRLSETYYPQAGMTADQVEDEIARIGIEAFDRATDGRVSFEVVHKVHVQEFPPYTNGFVYDFASFEQCTTSPPAAHCEEQKWLADYDTWVVQNQFCELADQYDADEIWVVSSPYLLTWEAYMIGPTAGFNVNGGTYIVPGCDRHFVVMNPTYERLDTVMHNYGHRVEATMSYLTERWSAEDRAAHWESFSAIARYGDATTPWPTVNCGNAHFPPNATGAYDYGNQTVVTASCADWGNFPDYLGTTAQISCSDWGCTDNGWNEYWMGSVPKLDGNAMLTDDQGGTFAFPRDWWSLALYPDAAIEFRAMLDAP
jgi:hypothetical protein